MNVSSLVGQNTSFGSATPLNVNKISSSPIKGGANPAEQDKVEQDLTKKSTPNIVIDEQAISSFKENQAIQSSLYTQKDNDKSSTGLDLPSAKNETAIANYQTVGNLAQRASVQKLFGVDLFA